MLVSVMTTESRLPTKRVSKLKVRGEMVSWGRFATVVKRRAAEKGPGPPGLLAARTRQKYVVLFASGPTCRCVAVSVESFTTGVVKLIFVET